MRAASRLAARSMPVYSVPRNWASSRLATNCWRRAADARRSASTRSSLLDLFQEGLSGLAQLFKRRLVAEGRQCLLQVEASIRPIAGGHGDPGAVEQLLSLLPHDR